MWTGDVLLNPKMLRYECQKSNFNKKTEKLFLNKIGHFPMCDQKFGVRRRFRVILNIRLSLMGVKKQMTFIRQKQ